MGGTSAGAKPVRSTAENVRMKSYGSPGLGEILEGVGDKIEVRCRSKPVHRHRTAIAVLRPVIPSLHVPLPTWTFRDGLFSGPVMPTFSAGGKNGRGEDQDLDFADALLRRLEPARRHGALRSACGLADCAMRPS